MDWWFDGIKSKAGVSDFDIIGFSYYPLWHTTISPDQISEKVANVKARYGKDVVMLETAYPWTTGAADQYNNHFGNNLPLAGYPFTPQGQYELMVKLSREMKEGGGIGLIY